VDTVSAVDVPVTPPVAAEMVAVPAATVVTVAVAVVVSPATTWAAESATDTLATDTFSTGTGAGVSSELPAQAPREMARAASAGARRRRPALRTEGNMVVSLEPVMGDWDRAALCKR